VSVVDGCSTGHEYEKVAGTDNAGYMLGHGKCLVEHNAKKLDCVRELKAGASQKVMTSDIIHTSKSGCCSKYHRFSLRWVQQKTILKERVADVINAVDQLRQTVKVETLRLDGK